MPSLWLRDVVLRRGASLVFDGLSLELTERRIGLIGDNGSGKSSLLRLMNGLLLPDAGAVEVCGFDTRAHRKELPGLAGFLFQNPDHQILFPTAGEEITFGLRETGMAPAAATAQMRAILAERGCDDWEQRPVEELSDGQRQRLCIMAVMAMEPKVLLLDEPFASLDLPTRRALATELMVWPQQILLATHDFTLLDCFDRVIWLHKGQIAADGAPGKVLAEYERDAGLRHEPATLQAAAQ
ncbi:MAG: energy-coupling factor ABC transporter ATP-binding protein [Beijerinckiaceae bacterium]